MHFRSTSNFLLNTILSTIVVTFIMLPMAPVSTMAAEIKNSEEIVILQDQSKSVTHSPQSETPAENQDVSKEQPTSEPQADATEVEDKSMSTGMKVAIGVGVGAVAIAGIAVLAGGGGGSSSPTPPTESDLVGVWQANAVSVDGRTYTGTYTLYAGGSHRFDVYVSDGNHYTGSGAWKLNEYFLELRNYNHSTYQGSFEEGNKSSVTLTSSDKRWQVTITK